MNKKHYTYKEQQMRRLSKWEKRKIFQYLVQNHNDDEPGSLTAKYLGDTEYNDNLNKKLKEQQIDNDNAE